MGCRIYLIEFRTFRGVGDDAINFTLIIGEASVVLEFRFPELKYAVNRTHPAFVVDGPARRRKRLSEACVECGAVIDARRGIPVCTLNAIYYSCENDMTVWKEPCDAG